MERHSFTPAEIQALVTKPEHVQAEVEAEMSRAERRRLARAQQGVREDKASFAGKVMTRADTIQLMALYLERNVQPFDARLAAIERWISLQEQPWHHRVKVRFLARVDRVLRWLDAKGVRLVTLTENAE